MALSPDCRDHTIVGHGRRFRQAHDEYHERIWVRRGICHPCNKTFTILPDWLAPSAPFSLRCRQQACESIAAGDSVEHAAPHCKDPSRSPDPTTLRRWARRRLFSVCCWVKAAGVGLRFLQAPTILAWDLSALVVSSSSADHRRDEGKPAPISAHLRCGHAPGRR